MLFKWSQLATCINYCYVDAAVQEVWPIPNLDSLIELNIDMFGIQRVIETFFIETASDGNLRPHELKTKWT